jgi:hypothetical protein
MADIKIRKSVGKNGKNAIDDVLKIQELLNKHKSAGGYAALKLDMDCGKKTIAAITAFQSKVVGLGRPDSRVDPGGRTLAALNQSPGSVTPSDNGGGGGDKSGGGGGGGSKKKDKSGDKSGGGETKAELMKRLKGAMAKVAEANEAIGRRESFVLDVDYLEAILSDSRKRYKTDLERVRAAIKAGDEKRRAQYCGEVARTADSMKKCMEVVERSGKPLDGITVDKSIAASFRALSEKLKDDKSARAIEWLNKAEKVMEGKFTLIVIAAKAWRAANTAAIIALKAKRKMYEISVEDALERLKKLNAA